MVGLDTVELCDLPAAHPLRLELQRLDSKPHDTGGPAVGLMERPEEILPDQQIQNLLF